VFKVARCRLVAEQFEYQAEVVSGPTIAWIDAEAVRQKPVFLKDLMRTLQIGMLTLLSATLGFSQADNTKQNKRDGGGKGLTSEEQMENKSDLEITRKIRKAITDDKTLSTYGKNVKVISRNGKVTLKGPVNTEEEKSKIEALAKSAAGADNVTNQIEIVKKS